MAMITRIEDYFTKGCGRCDRFATPDCSTRQWIEGLNHLRGICLDLGMSEHVKWAHPTYMHAGRNICVMGAFRTDFRLSFMNAALLKDPHQILERQGANTTHPDCIRFTKVSQVAQREEEIRACLREAMDHATAGRKPEKTGATPDMPPELADALDNDPELGRAFHALTPGRQKSYVLNLNAARQSKTRIARIARFRDKILSGKGATER